MTTRASTLGTVAALACCALGACQAEPSGSDTNWVQTIPDEGWFVLFRFYGPERGFYDKTWKLPDFEKVN